MDFTPDELTQLADSQKAQEKKRNIAIAAIVGVVLLLIVIGAIGSNSSPPPQQAVDVDSPDVSATTAPASPSVGNETAPVSGPSNWTYNRRRDEVRNGEIIEASARSTNSATLGFPYGTVGLNILVRQHPEYGVDVIFQVDEGQILCRSYDGCRGTINIDGRSERLSLNASADHSSTVVFAASPRVILRKLQSARRVIVELPFYRAGNQQFTFDTAGLQWPPPQ